MSDSSTSRPTRPDQRRSPEEVPPARLAGWRRPPLWVRWALTPIGFAGLAAAVMVAIRGSSGPTTAEDSAAREANHEAQIVVAQDQAPHALGLRRAAGPRRALEGAIAADMADRLRRHELSGPFRTSRCTPTGDPRASRRAFRYTVRAGDVGYPFLGVVDLPARRLTW